MTTQTTNETTADTDLEVSLTNTNPVVVTTALTKVGLVLSVDGEPIGVIVDRFCGNDKPVTTLRLNVLYLPDGTAVGGTWRGNGQTGDFIQDEKNSLAYADLDVPGVGAGRCSYDFTIVVEGSGHERRDPVVTVFQVEDC